MTELIRNHRNAAVVDAARLHRPKARRERGQTLIEGPDLIRDALAAGAKVEKLFALPEGAPQGSLLVDERAMSRLAGTKSPRGPVAVVQIPTRSEIGSRDVVVAVGVSDPGNVGTLIRTAAAFGMAFAYTPGTADPWSPKTLRAGAAGQFQTPVVRISDISELDHTLVAAVIEGGLAPSDVTAEKVALLIGEEAAGLSAEVVEAADVRVTVPTPGATESLNAAVAAGIIINQLANRKGNGGPGV